MRRIDAYDTEYLRDAQDSKCPLASTDRALQRAAKKEEVTLFSP